MKRLYTETGFIILMVMFLLSTADVTYGGKNNAGYLNGKPFANLSSQIVENQAAISELKVTTDRLRSELDSQAENIRAFEVRITTNEDRIIDLESQISEDIINLRKALAQLTELSRDVDTNRTAIETLRKQIDANLQTLSGRLADMRADLEAETGELDRLQAQIGQTNTAVQAQILALQNQIDELNDSVLNGDYITTEDLGLINFQLNSLNSQVSILNSNINASQSKLDTLSYRFYNHYHRYFDQDRVYWYSYYYYNSFNSTELPSY